jgi:hypothetical protein
MVYFQTKNHKLGKFSRVSQRKRLVYFVAIWSILQAFRIVMIIWYVCWLIGIFAPVLVSITSKNLATLLGRCKKVAPKVFAYYSHKIVCCDVMHRDSSLLFAGFLRREKKYFFWTLFSTKELSSCFYSKNKLKNATFSTIGCLHCMHRIVFEKRVIHALECMYVCVYVCMCVYVVFNHSFGTFSDHPAFTCGSCFPQCFQ